MASIFQIGATEGTLTPLDELATPLPDPQQSFAQYRRKDKLGDMTLKGRGPKTILWAFPLVTVNEIAQIIALQSDDPIYVQSVKQDDTPAVYQVIMTTPDPREDGEHMNGFQGYRGNFSIEFIVLSEVV